MTKDPSSKIWQELNKSFGNKMFRGDEEVKFDIPVIPFISPSLVDASHFGGLPLGKISQFHGPEGCLDADTFIQYELRAPDGKRINHKGGTIKRLYERFHRLDLKGRGKNSKAAENTVFTAPSVNGEGGIFQNRIMDVVKTGYKKCLLIRAGEHEITATEEHKFWTGDKFVEAKDLKEGDVVHIHNKTPYTDKEAQKRRGHQQKQRKELLVKYHPAGYTKIVKSKTGKEYSYCRLKRSRAVVEASLNQLTLKEYIHKLNIGDTESLYILENDVHVHHIDDDVSNDSLTNLAVIPAKEHNKYHALKDHNKLRFISVPAEIEEIRVIGNRETYDIKMEFPHNNYIANGFVVHNSGKTFYAMCMAKEVQDKDPEAEIMWFDCEQSFNREWADVIGLDMSRFHYSDENNGAEVFSMICGRPSKTGKGKGTPGILDFNKEGQLNVKLIVVDSIAAIIPPAELDREMSEMEMAALARFLPKALRVTSAKLAMSDTALLCINHAKEAIGDNVNKYTYPGGRGLRYMLSLVVLFDTTQSKSATLFDEDGHKYGHRVDCTIEKTRGGPNKWKASTWLNFRDGCIENVGQEVALLGEAYGIVERPNKQKWKYNDIEISGMDNFFEYLNENDDLMAEIVEKCKEIKSNGGIRAAELTDVESSEEK